MAIKKAVHRRSVNREGTWSRTKKKLHKSTDFVKRQQFELLQIFRSFKTSTKVVVTSIFFGVFLLVIISVTHSISSISEKQKKLDDIEAQIKLQQQINEDVENEIKGDMDEIMERLAREKLEMLYPGEEVFINDAG